MKLHYAFLGAALVLAACGGTSDIDIGGGGGGGGDNGGGGDDPTDVEVPVDEASDVCVGAFVCAGDLTDVAFDDNGTPGDPTDDTLTLTGLPFDDDPLGAVYAYSGNDTANGFPIYINTNPTIFNQYLAIIRDTTGGEMTLGVVTIEGYQDFGYRGAWFELNDVTTSIPNLELVEYTGEYTGFMVFDGSGNQYVTTGDVTMEVDFTDSVLKGFIDNRTIQTVAGTDVPIPNPDVTGIPTLVLNDTTITDGTFSGTVNSYADELVYETGSYQGWFGGTGATSVGGLIEAQGDYDDGVTSLDTGVFTADCAGSTTGCAP